MHDNSFQLAAQRARQAYSLDEWSNLRPREQSEAIYRELRRIDADRAMDRGQRRGRAQRVAEHETTGAA
ncbi:MAG: hypothetical protein WDN25_20670 [Acetobacteraceae bacterium]